MNAPAKKVRIGDLLVQAGEITEAQLMEALAAQKQSGRKLGRILVEQGFVAEDKFLSFLSRQFGMPFIDLKNYTFHPEVVQLLPEVQARKYRAIILEKMSNSLLVGMADPMDIFAVDELKKRLGMDIMPAVVREADLMSVLDNVYRRTSEINTFASELQDELTDEQFDLGNLGQGDDDSNTPVARLLKSLLEDAVQIRASDIHIEPDEHVLRVRQRVDGVLQEQTIKETRIAPALVSRLKLMADLDISEKRLPQDGRFEAVVAGRSVDVRLSTMPVTHGESCVLRLLDQSAGTMDLRKVGMDGDMLRRWRHLISRPHGLILVTGPTGSGKTTTLYASLNEVNAPEKKIITAEDPVEYQLERINQVQVMPKIGLDFAKVLRATLRQDPDVLLVGEIRDEETAQIALRAAMTGHLVFSTLHTNDAVSSAMRLVDIGVEGYMAASAVLGIVAQRLVRRICDGCTTDAEPDDQQRRWLHAVLGEAEAEGIQFRRGAGCSNCNRTGYRGRIGVFELLEINEGMAAALRGNDPQAFADAAVKAPGYAPLAMSALQYAREGLTTLDEVLHLANTVDEQVRERLADSS